MNMPIIETGIELPRDSRGCKGKWPAFLKNLNVGDSFVTSIKMRNQLTRLSKSNNMKFTCRAFSETEIRIWRIE